MSEELDALRRRLYAPDVTPEEVERYRALAGESVAVTEPQERAATAQDDAGQGRRGRRRLLVALATVVVVALAGIGVAATSRPHPVRTPSAPPLAAPTAPSAFDDSTVALPVSVRASFVAALKAGRSAGLLRYFFDHPDALPAQLRTPGRADPYERFGVSTAYVFLAPSPAAEQGGRLTVAVTLDTAAAVQLRALRADSGMQSFIERLDDGGRSIPGVPVVRTAVYDGEAPTVLELTVPKGVRWDVVAVFTD